MIKGSCHCGAVQYEIRGSILRFVYCHCPDCRKFTGSAFNPALIVAESDFVVTAGESTLKAHESSPGKTRSFCRNCGCHLFGRAKERGLVIVLAGTLDDELRVKPDCHIWVKENAPWHEIGDSLPQYQEWMPKK